MAKRAKKTTTKNKKANKQLTINWHKDKNFQVITGLLCLFLAAYMLLSFSMYLFTWKNYLSDATQPLAQLFFENNTNIINGKLGIKLSHYLIFSQFGIAAYLIPYILGGIGLNLLMPTKPFALKRNIKNSIFLLLWISTFLSFIFSNFYPIIGGALGFFNVQWIEALLGKAGSGLLLLFLLTSFLAVAFDLSFEKVHLFFIKRPKDILKTQEEGIQEANDNFHEPLSNFQEKEAISSQEEPMYENTPVTKMEELSPIVEETIYKESINAFNETVIAPPAEPTVDLEVDYIAPTQPEAVSEELEVIIPEAEPEAITEEIKLETDIKSDDEDKANKVLEEFGEYDPRLDLGNYKFPVLQLMQEYPNSNLHVDKEELEANKNKIVETLSNYKIEISKIKATVGPTVTLYEIVPAPGVRISKIKGLENDIALSLAALGIRIIAPLPGRGTIGIEVPNQNPSIVSMKTVLQSEKFQNNKMELPIALGKTISNETFVTDLAKMPHLLMAGATGQGKSVGLNCILASLLYKKHPSELKLVLVDPKKVELTLFNHIERHFLAKLPDSEEAIITETKKVINTVNSLCIEMDARYDLLKNAHCRNLKEYNTKFKKRKLNPDNGHRFLPYIVLVIDEFADLIMTAGKEIELPIARLAQLARAIGIHLIVATQRPTTNIITGTIKANFPARIAFRVTSAIDSRTILDSGGANQLIGRGDMLYTNGNELVRLQCAFIDTPEVEQLCEYIGSQRGYSQAFALPEYVDEETSPGLISDLADRDEKFEDAARVLVLHQQGSTSLIQRKLKLGYNRAGRIMDQLEAAGIVGPFEGSKARQVLVPDDYSLEQLLDELNKN